MDKTACIYMISNAGGKQMCMLLSMMCQNCCTMKEVRFDIVRSGRCSLFHFLHNLNFSTPQPNWKDPSMTFLS